MGLLLTGSQDQALLALVVQEARAAADTADWYVGRTATQKLVYFVQRCGVPCGYRFDLHHYGPYCAEVTRDIEWLMADGVVRDDSNQQRYSNYGPGREIQELLDRHQGFVERAREVVNELVRCLVPLTPDRLELLATMDFVCRWVVAEGGTEPIREAAIARFLEVKGDKFGRADVECVFNAMQKARLVGTPAPKAEA